MHVFIHLHHFFARKKFSFFLNRKKSQSNFQTFNDQLSRKIKNAQYKNPNYAIELENENNYMRKFDDDDISKNITDFCCILLKMKQTVFQNSLFRDDLFKKICRKIQNKNEIMIIRNIDLLIVFFVHILTIYDVIHLIIFTKQLMKIKTTYFFFCIKFVHNSIFS